jgi:pimeloyl-ACP methyl ester carboxylesterase
MSSAKANGIDIEYDTFGDPAHPALLLVMGLGTQMTAWRPEFCARLAGRGYHVVRFDNRDIGLSTKIDALAPDLMTLLSGDRSGLPYGLPDMAADAIGLLDALGIERAHVAGASMGGMIVQEMMIRHADRLLSACSIMSTTGDRAVGAPSPEAMAMLGRPAAVGRDAAIERGIDVITLLSSPAYPMSPQLRRERSAENYDRSYSPAGTARQLSAILAADDRTEALGKVDLPTVVIHGESDPLVDVSGGKATAAAVPGAQLILIPGMGHDLPPELWDTFIEAIDANARRQG